MMKTLAMVLVLTALPALAEEAVDVPFHMPLLEGWSSETLPFPLQFAPQIDHEGLEELRFSPGMFDPEAEDFFSYAFVWWLPPDTLFSAEALARDLELYFAGLAESVAESRGLERPGSPHRVEMRTVSREPVEFVGLVETFDAFASEAPVYLMLRGRVVRCTAESHTAVLFELSPQPESHEVWRRLGEIRDGFRCSR
jgi:hypothetical protein